MEQDRLTAPMVVIFLAEIAVVFAIFKLCFWLYRQVGLW